MTSGKDPTTVPQCGDIAFRGGTVLEAVKAQKRCSAQPSPLPAQSSKMSRIEPLSESANIPYRAHLSVCAIWHDAPARVPTASFENAPRKRSLAFYGCAHQNTAMPHVPPCAGASSTTPRGSFRHSSPHVRPSSRASSSRTPPISSL